MTTFSSTVIGEESLLIQCSEILLGRGHSIRAVVSANPEIASWAAGRGLPVIAPGAGLGERLQAHPVDWLFSIANLRLLPADVIATAAKGAINFHDGPLPAYAGLNAPVWAILNREKTFGVTWHLIAGGTDEGDILEQRLFELAPDETALTLNMRCYAAAIDAFQALVPALETGAPTATRQDFSRRSYFGRYDRPAAGGLIDFASDADAIVALVRALDHGAYWNPLTTAKITARGRVILVGSATALIGTVGAALPGTVLDASEDGLVVATRTAPVKLSSFTCTSGLPIFPKSIASAGDVLASPPAALAAALSEAVPVAAKGEAHWRKILATLDPVFLPDAKAATGAPAFQTRTVALPPLLTGDRLLATLAVWLSGIAGKARFDMAYRDRAVAAAADRVPGHLSRWVPLRFDVEGPNGTLTFGAAAEALARSAAKARSSGAYTLDLIARDPALQPPTLPHVAITVDAEWPADLDGACLVISVPQAGSGCTLSFDAARLPEATVAVLAERLELLAGAVADGSEDATPVDRLPVLSAAQRDQVIHGWNRTETPFPADRCLHELVEAQAARTPDAIAIVFEDKALTYAALDAEANRVANVLRAMGVGPDTLVGLYMPRSLQLVIGALAIQKAGGAYVPLDPAYPADRVALYISDSAAPVILTRSDLAETLPEHAAAVLVIDQDARIPAAAPTKPASGVTPDNLAYVIYTSGSTGRPKGVMIEHRNVSNFFTGMDDRIEHDPPGTWLAVTSLSFDISVLELFYTLARGFKLVLSSDEDRALVSSGRLVVSDKAMDFSLYYWGNDDGAGPRKYELLLEGSKFADAHGFTAVWTPERHFHAFGGPFPNPSVTGAAVAAVTKNLSVRAGSCVSPLHHPLRIAEEWGVIDNLTNGRAGLALASGWQPDDFVLRPENAPPNNRQAMLDNIDQLRRLWRGEALPFPNGSGKMCEVVSLPRPVSKELDLWITTAGNPQTWRDAGLAGCHVLTHLLGQSIEEVEGKIKLYRAALKEAGHDPAAFKVTLMLHTYVAESRDEALRIAREPMIAYLKSAAGLIKQYAWAFPAFKRPAGVNNAFDLNLEELAPEELDGILDYAFRRYFEDSGLFGTVEDCVTRVEQLKKIGVDEVACLVDYGISVENVLAGLRPLAEVVRRSNTATGIPDDDFSIAAQILRHDVTHLQCTPSMARMLTMNDEARAALARVKHLMIGGEALPGALVSELNGLTNASIENMYGPTETTIWSLTETATPDQSVVNIGRPIANTRVYVLDADRQPVPVGVPGELYIGGEGVARGYWQREDLTAERFVADPFVTKPLVSGKPARMYRTGDLVRWRPDGKIDFLGRTDHQVKIRGFRIELGEIEHAIEEIPGVRQAVVVAKEQGAGDMRLVAYITADPSVSDGGVRKHLDGLLPAHMVPAHIVTLSEFPLTPNKKVDRKALPEPTAALEVTRTEAFVAAGSGVEQQIAEIWSRILGVPQVGANDNFFKLGGHSLLAVQAHREIKRVLGISTFAITDIFRYPKLADLAAHLAPAGAGSGPVTPEVSAEAEQARSEAISRRRAMRAGLAE